MRQILSEERKAGLRTPATRPHPTRAHPTRAHPARPHPTRPHPARPHPGRFYPERPRLWEVQRNDGDRAAQGVAQRAIHPCRERPPPQFRCRPVTPRSVDREAVPADLACRAPTATVARLALSHASRPPPRALQMGESTAPGTLPKGLVAILGPSAPPPTRRSTCGRTVSRMASMGYSTTDA